MENRNQRSEVLGEIAKTPPKQISTHVLEEMPDLAADGVIAVDVDQRIGYFSRRAERMFGYKHDEILGCTLDKLMPPCALDTHQMLLSPQKSNAIAVTQAPELARRPAR